MSQSTFMKRAGKVSLLTVLALVSALVVIVLLFMGGESPTSIASKFMVALAKGDVDTLTKMSYIDGKNEEQIKQAWDYTVNKVGPHYRFVFRSISAVQIDPTLVNVKFEVVTDALSGSSYPEFFEIPLKKVDNDWKVDTAAIDRKMYPGLPR